jgi:hypothetical protein
LSLIVTSDGIDPATGAKVEFYRAAGPEAARTQLWGTSVVRSRFPMLAQIERDLHVSPPEFDCFEEEATRLDAQATEVAKELGRNPEHATDLKRYARACLDAVEFARKFASDCIHYW